MFDFSFPELMVVMVLAVVVLGPKEIPKIMYGLGRVVRRVQYIRFAMSRQFEDFMREHDLDDIRKSINFEEKNFDEAASDEEDVELTPDMTPENKGGKDAN